MGFRRVNPLQHALLACALLALPGVPAADTPASASQPHPHVTARPPLQVVPAAPAGAASVQQRMRQCNSVADARKLHDAARESFVRSCMATHRPAPKPASSAAGESKHGS